MNRITLLRVIGIAAILMPFPLLAQPLDSSSIASGRQVAATICANCHECQSALDRDPVSASKRDPLVLRFERLAFAPSELAGVAETGRARVGV